ncbi:hypothetical protein RHSIM_Rhsim04G0183000 [Rhododendron simsii]|uniref:Major facilitator superfamily (MFS) profile domain-containing protein n=1 Tax=Rhododendron simsii TaxID=118357 RepID=A0A834H3H8_RHOSS|nr:hypothetical protein RHSIM_Rhsim04G0183000 [Rhododendron simsii]
MAAGGRGAAFHNSETVGRRLHKQQNLAMARDQLEVPNALDVAKTQLYDFTTIVIAGMGFFTAAYDLFSISVVTKLLGRIYYTPPNAAKPGVLPANVSSAVTCVALVGTLFGQLFFGWLGDKLSRKKVYGVTLLLMILCSLASGLSFGHHARATMATLCYFRFWLGFGIGGDYPLSATILFEYANKKTRGSLMAAVFAMQGFGILTSGIVGLIVSAAFETAMTYYWRMKMPETARYTAKVLNVEFDPEEANLEKFVKEPSNQYGLFSKEFLHRHGLHLLGTATCWFLLDISFYSQNLFQNYIFTIINWLPPAANMSGIEEVYKVSRAQTLIALCGTVPGYWFTVFFVDKIGRWIIQLQGFFFMTVFMFALGIPFHHWTLHKVPFIIMYSLTFFFANFGPNSTTFVLPAEIFPARLRSTCHGLSAAAGKAGAIVGAFGFLYTSEPSQRSQDDAGYPPGIIGVKYSFIVLGFVSLFGMVFTFLIPESNGKSLEELSGENEDDSIDAVEESTLDRQGAYNPNIPV